MSGVLGRLIAWYAVWCAWKRRNEPPASREFNAVVHMDWKPEPEVTIAYYDAVDPAELRWHPHIPPPLPRYIVAGSPARIVWWRS